MRRVNKTEWRAILAELEYGRHPFICHAAAEIAAPGRWADGLCSELLQAVGAELIADGVSICGNGFASEAESVDGTAPAWVVAIGADPHERRIAYVRLKIAQSD